MNLAKKSAMPKEFDLLRIVKVALKKLKLNDDPMRPWDTSEAELHMLLGTTYESLDDCILTANLLKPTLPPSCPNLGRGCMVM